MKQRLPVLAAPVLAAALAFAPPAASDMPPLPRASDAIRAPELTQLRLDNGLTVVLEENHRAPFVAMQLRYAAGARYEPAGREGLALITQRMTTLATKHVAEGEYARWLDRVGAFDHGWGTSADWATIWATVPSDAVPTMLWLWSDQMGFFEPRADRALLDEARATSRNERREKVENAAYGAVREIALSALYPSGHPYHARTLAAALDAIGVDDVRAFHARRFGPNGAALVLSGDFKSADVVDAIQRYFGSIPPAPSEPAPMARVGLGHEVRLDVAARVQSPMVQMNWRTPAFYDDGDAEMDIAAKLLSGSRTAALHWELVDRRKIATQVHAQQFSRALGSDFQISAMVAPGHAPDEVIRAIDEVLLSLRGGTLRDEALRAAVETQTIPRIVDLDRGGRRATLFAQYALLRHDAAWLLQDVGRYEAITARDVGAAATRWLRPDDRVVTVVTPDPSAPPCGELRATRGAK